MSESKTCCPVYVFQSYSTSLRSRLSRVPEPLVEGRLAISSYKKEQYPYIASYKCSAWPHNLFTYPRMRLCPTPNLPGSLLDSPSVVPAHKFRRIIPSDRDILLLESWTYRVGGEPYSPECVE